ncbi:hypothetical protein Ancab_015445, partial [Ancistrocladus abbreviatus]
ARKGSTTQATQMEEKLKHAQLQTMRPPSITNCSLEPPTLYRNRTQVARGLL